MCTIDRDIGSKFLVSGQIQMGVEWNTPLSDGEFTVVLSFQANLSDAVMLIFV